MAQQLLNVIKHTSLKMYVQLLSQLFPSYVSMTNISPILKLFWVEKGRKGVQKWSVLNLSFRRFQLHQCWYYYYIYVGNTEVLPGWKDWTVPSPLPRDAQLRAPFISSGIHLSTHGCLLSNCWVGKSWSMWQKLIQSHGRVSNASLLIISPSILITWVTIVHVSVLIN